MAASDQDLPKDAAYTCNEIITCESGKRNDLYNKWALDYDQVKYA